MEVNGLPLSIQTFKKLRQYEMKRASYSLDDESRNANQLLLHIYIGLWDNKVKISSNPSDVPICQSRFRYYAPPCGVPYGSI